MIGALGSCISFFVCIIFLNAILYFIKETNTNSPEYIGGWVFFFYWFYLIFWGFISIVQKDLGIEIKFNNKFSKMKENLFKKFVKYVLPVIYFIFLALIIVAIYLSRADIIRCVGFTVFLIAMILIGYLYKKL